MSHHTTPLRAFGDYTKPIHLAAVFPDRRRMVTGSDNNVLRLWNLETGVMLKKMEGHRSRVSGLAASRDGKMIASGDVNGEVITWHGETGEILTQPICIKAHSINYGVSLDFSADGTVLASGSSDCATKLWSTTTWQLQGNPIQCNALIRCILYSPSGKYLAIATSINIEVYNPGTRECVANFKAHTSWNESLAWTPDGKRLLSVGGGDNPTIREWDASTWRWAGDPWKGHTSIIYAIAINPTGTLVASVSEDNDVRLWRLSDGRTIAIFKHSSSVTCVTFSMDGKHIFSGGLDKMISEWAVPKDALSKDGPKEQVLKALIHRHGSILDSYNTIRAHFKFMQILAITTTVRDACITGDLSTAEELLTQEIDNNANNYTSYAARSFVMARELDWDHALQDAIKSVSIKPSLSGCISKGIALCGKMQIQDAMKAFDFAFMCAHEDLKTTHFLLLIKAIALFNANEHDEAILCVQELAVMFPNADPLACHIVEAYLRVQLGTISLNSARYKEVANHFTAAVKASASFSKLAIHSMYEGFTVLFGWDLESLWQTANKQRCLALLRIGQVGAALEAYRYMMDMSDEPTKAIFLAWFTDLNEE